MMRKLTIFVCLVSFCPAAAGAQELAAIAQNPSTPIESPANQQPAREVDLSIRVSTQVATLVAANDQQGSQAAEAERPRKTHSGLTFGEFVDVHFGDYRWVWWAGAAAALVAIHAL